MYQVDLSYDSRIGQDIAISYDYDPVYWQKRHFYLIKDKVNLITSFSVARTSLLISFMNIVTIYDMFRKRFIKHLIYDYQIKSLLKTDKTDRSDDKVEQLSYIGIILANNDVLVLE
jgi:hypothetical protein